jgi:folate-dependent phosphoribosylglycinamide formyltransferase PurN
MKKVVVLASGSGTLARAIFAADKEYEISALICDQPTAQVIVIANEFGIKVELLEIKRCIP